MWLEHIKKRQKQLERKRRREAELEAKKEAARVAKMEAEARKQEEIAARKKLLLEQQEDERLHHRHIQRKEKQAEQKWDNQFDMLLAQIKDRQQKDKELEEIRVIIQNREPSLQELDWATWLSDPLNQRLADLDFDYAMEMFKRDNLMSARRKKTHGKTKRRATINYALSFTGDSNTETRRGDLVATDFNPDDYSLNLGMTISYWVRPDELGSDMFCIGRKAHNNARFTFGISNGQKGYFSIGANQSEEKWETMLDEAGLDKASYLTEDGSKWFLTIGRWYHFVVTYVGNGAPSGEKYRRIFMDGQQIWGMGVSDPANKGSISWSDTGREMNHNLSFGMRAVRGSGTTTNYNNGWACGLDEVAIYNEEKGADWVANVYNGNTSYNHTGESGLVGYWRFNEGSGITAGDLSGNGNNGLLTNDSHGDDGGAAFASGTPTWFRPPAGYGQ